MPNLRERVNSSICPTITTKLTDDAEAGRLEHQMKVPVQDNESHNGGNDAAAEGQYHPSHSGDAAHVVTYKEPSQKMNMTASFLFQSRCSL
jgi:hypothetical protein